MDLSLVVTRLQARTTGMREIGQAADLDAAMNQLIAAPAIYVMPLAERGIELGTTGVTDQLVRQLIGVLHVVDTAAATQAGVLQDLRWARQQTRAALVGWVPDESTGEPVLFDGGELVQFAGDGRLWWSDEFVLTHYYRSTSQ